jgi:hypothetical protein
MRRRLAASSERRVVAIAAAVALLACACAGAPATEAREPSNAARLVLECEVDDAAVWVDGSYVGEVGHLRSGFPVELGTRRVEMRHDRYHTYYARIALEPHERVDLQVYLAPQLP